MIRDSQGARKGAAPTVILLGATRNTDNYGVRVLLSAATDAVVQAFPEASVLALEYGPPQRPWTEETRAGKIDVDVIPLRFGSARSSNNIFRLLGMACSSRLLPPKLRGRIWNTNPSLRRIATADIVLSIAGGDSFSDIYGVQRFIYVTAPQFLVLLLGKPLVQLPQTYGPYRTALARRLARFILKRSSAVYSRDPAGVETLRTLMAVSPPDVHVMPDLGLRMAPEAVPNSVLRRVEQLRACGPLVGFNASSLLHMGGYNGRNMFGLREDFTDLVDKVISAIATKPDVQLLLIPHVCGGPESQEDETRLCRQLLARHTPAHTNIHYVDEPMNHRQIKSLIGACDVFMGARMHACIAAVSQAVPTVCLAYSDKFAGVMAPFGAGAQVVDLRTSGADAVIRAFAAVFLARSALRVELAAALEQLPSFAAELRTVFRNLSVPLTPPQPPALVTA